MRVFIVVAQDRVDLYEYFLSAFSGVEGIDVILDRRVDAGRYAGAHRPLWSSERRGDRDIYDELRTRGFVIARLPA